MVVIVSSFKSKANFLSVLSDSICRERTLVVIGLAQFSAILYFLIAATGSISNVRMFVLIRIVASVLYIRLCPEGK
jgi:hypothetical protein